MIRLKLELGNVHRSAKNELAQAAGSTGNIPDLLDGCLCDVLTGQLEESQS